MIPVEKLRNAGLDRFRDAEPQRCISVLGRIVKPEPAKHRLDILGDRPVSTHISQRRLPRMSVGIHETGNDDVTTDVDGLAGLDIDLDRGQNLENFAAFYENIADELKWHSFIHRNNRSTPK